MRSRLAALRSGLRMAVGSAGSRFENAAAPKAMPVSVAKAPRSRTLHPRSMTGVQSAAAKFIPQEIAAALGGTVSEMFPDFA